ncbi:DUF4097 family beta strand repeat-containing protein [Kitasatospora sp. NPDC058965]|uniref:DUF4097 family beta strand repeat-containing protein n=1 Tax=Kitasatospora sp. NPDC058965 TaxID=3346682 RepID=UPI0036C0586A
MAGREDRTWRALSAAAAALVLLVGGGQAWKVLAEQAHVDQYRYERGIRTVELDLQSSSVVVTGETGDAVSVDQRERWTLDRPRVTRSVTGSTLHLTARCPRSWLPTGGPCGVQFSLVVPPGTNLTVKSGSGAVFAEGITGDISARTDSGSVGLKRDSGRIAVHVGSGSVTGQDLGADQVRAQVDSGSIDLAFARPPQDLTMATNSGSAQAGLPPGSTYRVLSSAGSGGVDVDPGLQDAASARTITATTGSGHVGLAYTS